jgi:hypothetical protein
VTFEVLKFDHQREHEADVRARQRVRVRRTLRRASVHVDDADALIALALRVTLCALHDSMELVEGVYLYAEMIECRCDERLVGRQEVHELAV